MVTFEYSDLQRFMPAWAKNNYQQGIEDCRHFTEAEREFASLVLRAQRRFYSPMDGKSVQGLRTYEGASEKVSFSGAFEASIEEGFLTPASYVLHIVRSCTEAEMTTDETIEMTGRALRAFPSFVREVDLTVKLSQELAGSECWRPDAEHDISDHTDIYISYHDELFSIWSYLNTARGIGNVVQKLRGERGALPTGNHVLCPLDMDGVQSVEYYNWRLYSPEYCKAIAKVIESGNRDEYQAIQVLSAKEYEGYVKSCHVIHVA